MEPDFEFPRVTQRRPTVSCRANRPLRRSTMCVVASFLWFAFGAGPRGDTVHHRTGDLPGPKGSAGPDSLRFPGQLLPTPIQAVSWRQETSWSRAKNLHHFRDQELTSDNIPAPCLSLNALKSDAIAACTGHTKTAAIFVPVGACTIGHQSARAVGKGWDQSRQSRSSRLRSLASPRTGFHSE